MSEMLELAKRIAERAGKNAKVAPELLYAPILWELQDDARSSAESVQSVGLDKARLDAAYEAYWANSSGTYMSIEAAILSYINTPATVPQTALAWPKEEIEPGRFVDVDPEVLAVADKTEALRKQAFALSCHEQFRLASFVAENLGYVLSPDPLRGGPAEPPQCQAGSEQQSAKDAIEECARIVERWSLPTIQTPSMWLVDKAGIAAEIRALTRPMCTCGGDPDQPAAQHDLTCPATLTSHQRGHK